MQKRIKKNKKTEFLLITFLFIAPFVQSNITNEDAYGTTYLHQIPSVIGAISSYLRWFLFITLSIISIINLKTYLKYFTKINLFYTLFYVPLFLYAMVTITDVTRYFSLLVFSFFIPLLITNEFKTNNRIFCFKNINKIIYFSLLLSIFVSFKIMLFGGRFQGVVNNSNLYGGLAVFWLSILLVSFEKKKNSKSYLMACLVIFITIIFSGSRAGIVMALTVIFFTFFNRIKNLVFIFIIGGVAIYYIFQTMELTYILERFYKISSSVQDSGRGSIWKLAFSYIKNSYWGYGMDAPIDLLSIGNVHNCYIRFLLTVGIPLTVLTMLNYIILLILSFSKRRNIPRPLIGFLIAFALGNLGEDYYVGAGSSMYIYVLFTIGLVSYFYKKEKHEKTYY